MFGDDVRGWNLSFKKVHDHFTDGVDLIFVGMQQHLLPSITVAFFQNGTDERKMTLKSFHAVFFHRGRRRRRRCDVWDEEGPMVFFITIPPRPLAVPAAAPMAIFLASLGAAFLAAWAAAFAPAFKPALVKRGATVRTNSLAKAEKIPSPLSPLFRRVVIPHFFHCRRSAAR